MVSSFFAFSGLVLLAQFSPGPDMMLITRTSLHDGWRAGAAMAFGIACGLTVHSTVAIWGVTTVMNRLPALRWGIQALAAIYLTWLAIGILREHFKQRRAPSSAISQPAARSPFLRGLFCNVLNPNAAIFLAAIFTSFMDEARPAWWPIALAGIVVGQGFFLWALWARLMQWAPLRKRYLKLSKWLDLGFALALIILAFAVLIS